MRCTMNDLILHDPLYDRTKASNYISLDITTLDKWIAAQKFPQPDLKMGRKPMWRLSTINKFINALQWDQETLGCR